ncbi:MAG: cytochrome C [Flavobacteriales bacterium]|nr:MAG: cytochrome C [Flavobacteriales bacterium]
MELSLNVIFVRQKPNKMKNLFLIAFLMIFLLISCQNKKAKTENNESQATQSENNKTQIELGKKLYAENMCNTCHLKDQQNIGPSTTKIVEMYRDKDKSIVAFLQGKSEPFVDTDKGQIAVMQTNVEAFVNKLSSEELDAIEVYMKHVADN